MRQLQKAATVAAFLITVGMLIHTVNANIIEPYFLGFEDKTLEILLFSRRCCEGCQIVRVFGFFGFFGCHAAVLVGVATELTVQQRPGQLKLRFGRRCVRGRPEG